MEIEVQKFVSTKEISKERLEVREARERVLKDAERKAEARFANFSKFWGIFVHSHLHFHAGLLGRSRPRLGGTTSGCCLSWTSSCRRRRRRKRRRRRRKEKKVAKIVRVMSGRRVRAMF